MGMQKIVRCKPLILIQDFLDKYVDFLTYIFQEPALEGGFSNFMELLSSSSPVSLRLSTSTVHAVREGAGPGAMLRESVGETCQERTGKESQGGHVRRG